MNKWLRRLWFEPRRSPLRHWMRLVHTWAGVGAGLYLAMMGLTGALSVFLPELRNTLVAPIHAPAGKPPMSLQSLQTNIEQASSGARFRAVFPGQTSTQAPVFEEQISGRGIREFVLDPYTGRVLIERNKGANFYDWVRNLHADLLTGKVGRTINGFGGILLLFTGLAGLVIWWPGSRHVKLTVFRVSARKGWRRLAFDLHRLAGVLVLVPLCIAAVTGIGLAFPRLSEQALVAVLDPQSGAPKSQVARDASNGKCKSVTLDAVLQIARMRLPGAAVTRIQAPSAHNGNDAVFMHLSNDWRDEGDNRVLVESRSGAVIEVRLGRQAATSTRAIAAMSSIHFGQYGGTASRILAVLVGLTFPLLFVTGVTLWLRRVVHARRVSRAVLVSAPEVRPDDLYVAETR